MESNFMAKSACATLFCVMVLLAPTKAVDSYDVLCPDSENPLNVLFKAPTEVLSNGKPSSDIVKIAIDFIDPEDVACKTNYDDVTVQMFQRAVNCSPRDSKTVACEVKPTCTAHRVGILSRYRHAAMKNLNEVMKIKAIHFFNVYQGAKRLIFGDQMLSDLSGLEIVKRATIGQHNFIKGFEFNKYLNPSREMFSDVFSRPVELYTELKMYGEPTGKLVKDDTCVRVSKTAHITESEMQSCYDLFFNSYKYNYNVADEKLIRLIIESLEWVVNYLSDGKQYFSGVKIPFTGPCVGNKGPQPNTPYSNLRKTVEMLKLLEKSA